MPAHAGQMSCDVHMRCLPGTFHHSYCLHACIYIAVGWAFTPHRPRFRGLERRATSCSLRADGKVACIPLQYVCVRRPRPGNCLCLWHDTPVIHCATQHVGNCKEPVHVTWQQTHAICCLSATLHTVALSVDKPFLPRQLAYHWL